MKKLVLLLLLSTPVLAFPDLKGKIISSGASVNNLTTAAPFQLPQGGVSVLCNAAAYLAVGLTNSTSATSDGVPLAANVEKPFTLAGGRNVIAILPVAGPVTCRVWALVGDTIAYRASGDGGASTTGVQGSLLGQPLSSDRLVLTRAAPGSDAITLRENTYIRMAPTVASANAHFKFNPDTGFEFASSVLSAPGGFVWTDGLISRQGDRSVRIEQAQGLGFSPRTSLPVCDNIVASGHAREGDMLALSAASVSGRTRLCLCTANGADPLSFAWLTLDTGTVGTASTCVV